MTSPKNDNDCSEIMCSIRAEQIGKKQARFDNAKSPSTMALYSTYDREMDTYSSELSAKGKDKFLEFVEVARAEEDRQIKALDLNTVNREKQRLRELQKLEKEKQMAIEKARIKKKEKQTLHANAMITQVVAHPKSNSSPSVYARATNNQISTSFKLNNPICTRGGVTYEDKYTVQCTLRNTSGGEFAKATYNVGFDITTTLFESSGYNSHQVQFLLSSVGHSLSVFNKPRHLANSFSELPYSESFHAGITVDGIKFRTSTRQKSLQYGNYMVVVPQN